MGNKNDELPKKMEQYNGNEMKNVISPEWLEIWDMCHILVIHDEVYFYANNNNSSFWVEDNESIIKKKGQGSSIMARVIIKSRQQADSYWKSENMIKQLREKAIPIFNALHLGCISKSTNHNAYAFDVLMCSRMTLYPKVEKKFEFKNSWCIRNYEKIIQPMFFLDKKDGIVKFKGIKKKNDEKVSNCCARHTLMMKPDFSKQKTSIAETVEAAGHIFELYPNFTMNATSLNIFGVLSNELPINNAWRYIEAYSADLEEEDAKRA
ncbi:153_t:CDS:2, partial [Cetraspora pellucida]